MTDLSGQLLVATPNLIDPNFYRTVVLIVSHDQDGALGLVLNRPTTVSVADHLPEWAELAVSAVVHFGGPVEPDMAIGLGRQSHVTDLEPSGVSMVDLAAPSSEVTDVKVFSGYAGWTAGQLEDEIDDGAWFLVPATSSDAFSDDPDLWRLVLRRQSGPLSVVSTYAEDPSLN